MFVEIIAGLVIIVFTFYFYLMRNRNYWKKKQVVFIEPTFPFGLLQDQALGKSDTGTILNKYYTEYKKQGLKYVGGFTIQQPTLILLDLNLCKQILTTDFNHFLARDFVPTTHEYISKHLVSLEGQEWKDMRLKLVPTFTAGKIKNMFVLMEECGKHVQEHIDSVVLEKGEFQVKDLIARYTTDIIATCAFGLEVNSVKERDNEFYKTGQLIFVSSLRFPIVYLMHKNFPKTARMLGLNFFNPRISEVLLGVMKDNVQYRKQNNVYRKDFVDCLLKVKENKSLEDDDVDLEASSRSATFLRGAKSDTYSANKDQLTIEEMTAQAFIFFAAGFETAASTTTFCLFELAKNPDVQEKLRQEIDEAMANHGGKITYQAIQEMTYMEQVVNETLRLYASLPLLTRVCTEPYQFPGTDLKIDKGVRVHVPTYAIHHDPDIYPDPYRFDPDRFSDQNSKDRHHYAFLPFGEGPRICIGLRFGKLQVKLGLVTILSKYELAPAADTPSKLEIDPMIIFTTPKHPFRLRIQKRAS